MEAYDIKKMKDLEGENRRLKKMFADLSLECCALKDIIEKSFKNSDKVSICQPSDRAVCHELTSGMQDIVVEQDGISLSAGYTT